MNIRFYHAKILMTDENKKFSILNGELWVKNDSISYIGDGKEFRNQKEDAIIDSLFDAGAAIEYGLTNTMKVVVNTDKLNNLLDCDKMLIRFNVSTESISSDPVQFRESDYICVRLRMLAKVTEIDLNDFE